MNYRRPDLLDRLAADHVTGLMVGRARGRFARLCGASPAAARARRAWEDRLLPLALAAPPVTPSSACWTSIARAVAGPDAVRSTGARSTVRCFARASWLAAAAILVGVALLVGRQWLVSPTWQPVAVLAPAQAAPLWRVERDAKAEHLSIRTLGRVTLAATNSYELWVLPAGKGNPVSLGVLPRAGNLERVLTPDQRRYLLAGAKVAVSVEPDGGSPTGLPTGPVVIVADIVSS